MIMRKVFTTSLLTNAVIKIIIRSIRLNYIFPSTQGILYRMFIPTSTHLFNPGFTQSIRFNVLFLHRHRAGEMGWFKRGGRRYPEKRSTWGER